MLTTRHVLRVSVRGVSFCELKTMLTTRHVLCVSVRGVSRCTGDDADVSLRASGRVPEVLHSHHSGGGGSEVTSAALRRLPHAHPQAASLLARVKGRFRQRRVAVPILLRSAHQT